MKTALLFGSSGLVGGHLLNQLIKDNNYNKIKIFVRLEPVTRAMIAIVQRDTQQIIFESNEIVEASKN